MIVSKNELGEAAQCFTVRKVPKLRSDNIGIVDIFTQTKNNSFDAIDLNTETGDARILGVNDQVHNMRDVEFALVVRPEKVHELIRLLQSRTLTIQSTSSPWYKRLIGR
jgi:hypothetical protein